MLCTLAKKLDDMSRFLLPKNLTGRSSFPLNSTQFPWQLFKSLYAQLRGQLWEHKAHKGTIVCESLPASVNLGHCLELQDHLPLDPETPRVVQKWPFLLSIMLNTKEL